MTPDWYEDLAVRLRLAHDEALFSGDPAGAEAFVRAQLRAYRHSHQPARGRGADRVTRR